MKIWLLQIKNINYEIILVNDGSTDSSLQILQEYAKKDDRIKNLKDKAIVIKLKDNQIVSFTDNISISNIFTLQWFYFI